MVFKRRLVQADVCIHLYNVSIKSDIQQVDIYFLGCAWNQAIESNTVYSFEFAQSYFRPMQIPDWFAKSWIRPLSIFLT